MFLHGIEPDSAQGEILIQLYTPLRPGVPGFGQDLSVSIVDDKIPLLSGFLKLARYPVGDPVDVGGCGEGQAAEIHFHDANVVVKRYTPATTLLYGLREALNMLQEEGFENVFQWHERHARATRVAVAAWGLEILATNPAEQSNALTAVLMPDNKGANELRKTILDAYDMSLGTGLNKVADKVFRIGHLGDFNDLMLMGTLCGVEMGLARTDVEYTKGGAQAAMDLLSD